VDILPVVVVSSGGATVAPSFSTQVAGQTIVTFQCRLIALDSDLLPRWERTRSPVLAVLAALLRHSRHGVNLLPLLLPLIQHLPPTTTCWPRTRT